MAVSDWSTNPVNNTHINGYSLSGPYGHVFATMMAELKTELDSIKASIEGVDDAMGEWTTATPARTTTAKAAIEAAEARVTALETAMGSWTDSIETTAVKPAIEALRPEPEAEG